MDTPPEPPSEPDANGSPSLNRTTSSCQVCGDAATIINYGALSCLSCRTFFRRNAFHVNETATCRFNGDCEVNILTRKLCAACRLAKCLSIGMSPELIRKEDLSGKKRKSLNEEILHQPIVMKIPSRTTTDPRASSSPLDHSERTRIANIGHAFDTYSPIGEIRRRTKPLDQSGALDILSLFYQSIRSFIGSTPDFQILTIREQTSLFQRNMAGLFALGTVYLTRECALFCYVDGETTTLLPFFANEPNRRAKAISERLDADPTVMKLLLVALAFSSNCSIMDAPTATSGQDSLLFGTFRLFGSQNVYAELIWKYLIHSYGLQDSIQRFLKLIQSLLDIFQLANEIYASHSTFQQFLHARLEPNETSAIPLWGKQ